ncbi:MAG TPA: tripartite tricarboxylate transporter TctB family protein [Aurantimonas sp.]|nr:tripartite tricarboxylate transporter TctB family protein [Aurantimonas sp.]
MGQIFVALAAIALAVFFWSEAENYPATAAQLPELLAFVVIALSVAAIASAAWSRLRPRAAAPDGENGTETPTDWRSLAIGAGFLVLIVTYAWSITRIGYLVATPLFLAIPLAALRPVGLVAAVSTIVVVTAIIFGVFVWFLNLSIPLYPAL